MAAFLSKFLRPYAIARTVSNIFVVENHPSIIYYPTSPSRSFSSISESKPSLFLCNVELGMPKGYGASSLNLCELFYELHLNRAHTSRMNFLSYAEVITAPTKPMLKVYFATSIM